MEVFSSIFWALGSKFKKTKPHFFHTGLTTKGLQPPEAKVVETFICRKEIMDKSWVLWPSHRISENHGIQ